jgi:catechol 2,3-dioxygenase-like lactoylglutathione lyase family enzyme
VRSAEPPRIFRVLLQVGDLEQSQQFYESLLATRGRRVGGGRAYFDCGSVILALLDPSVEGGKAVSPLPEPVYFATADLEGAHRRAHGLGCLSSELIHNDPANPAGEMVVRPWGERSFYAADPSGNPLCFVDSRSLFTGTARQTAALRGAPSHRRSARPRSTQRRPKGRSRSGKNG